MSSLLCQRCVKLRENQGGAIRLKLIPMQGIQDAVDSADDGVILFSLGFSFIPDRLPKAQVNLEVNTLEIVHKVYVCSKGNMSYKCICLTNDSIFTLNGLN